MATIDQASFAEELLGPGFYKLAYVTTDREKAIERLQEQLGIEAFFPFEPEFDVDMSDGRSGHAKLRCAFSVGRDIVIEVMQPHEGLVDVWADPLDGADGFALRFHHIGLITDDLDGVKAHARERDLDIALETDIPNVGSVIYIWLPTVGHYVEHMQYIEGGGALLEGVKSGAILERES